MITGVLNVAVSAVVSTTCTESVAVYPHQADEARELTLEEDSVSIKSASRSSKDKSVSSQEIETEEVESQTERSPQDKLTVSA
ncbi:MAG: hypothetical protein ACOZBL_03560 [Patescibacteria group bacterium]